MRTDRRGSVTIEGLMVLPVAVTTIFLSKFVLEASLNRQEAAVFARGSAITAASAGRTSFGACDFDRSAFTGRNGIAQSAIVNCHREDAERGLSQEEPVWDALETAAAPWDDILRDVTPRTGPRDFVATAEVTMTFQGTDFLAQQDPTLGKQSYLASERTLWTHDDSTLAKGHDQVIWDELCKSATFWMFPNVFPNAGRPQC